MGALLFCNMRNISGLDRGDIDSRARLGQVSLDLLGEEYLYDSGGLEAVHDRDLAQRIIIAAISGHELSDDMFNVLAYRFGKFGTRNEGMELEQIAHCMGRPVEEIAEILESGIQALRRAAYRTGQHS